MATKKAVSKSSTSKKPKVSVSSSTVKATTVKSVVAPKSSWLSRLPLNRTPLIAALIAEFIGTFMLAAVMIAGQGQPIILLFGIAGIVLLIGTLSGAHINPAITIAAWITRRITGLRALGYIVAQFLGAGLAFAILTAFVNGAAEVSAQAAAYGQTAAVLFQVTALPEGKEWFVFFAELLGATIFGFALANALREKRDRVAAALTVGFGLFVALLIAASAVAFVGGNIAVLNPAVALSLGALKFETWSLAIYILAPIIGAVVGFILHDAMRVADDVTND